MLRLLLCGLGGRRETSITSNPKNSANLPVSSNDRDCSDLPPKIFIASTSRLGSLVQQGTSDISLSYGNRVLLSLTACEGRRLQADDDFTLYFRQQEGNHQVPWLSARLAYIADGLDLSIVKSLIHSLGPRFVAGLSLIAESFFSDNQISPSHQISHDLPHGIKNICLSPAYVKDRTLGSLNPFILLEVTRDKARSQAASSLLAPVKMNESPQPSALPPIVDSSNVIGSAEQWSLLRAGAMISAIPCIATLMELRPSGESAGHPGQLFSGRILMQNELSLAYWGKLDQMDRDGSWLVVKTLLVNEDETASVTSLMGYLKRLKRQPARHATWKHIIKVPASPVIELRPSFVAKEEACQPDEAVVSSALVSLKGFAHSVERSNSLSRAASSVDVSHSQNLPSIASKQSAAPEESMKSFTVAPSKAMLSILHSLEQNESTRDPFSPREGRPRVRAAPSPSGTHPPPQSFLEDSAQISADPKNYGMTPEGTQVNGDEDAVPSVRSRTAFGSCIPVESQPSSQHGTHESLISREMDASQLLKDLLTTTGSAVSGTSSSHLSPADRAPRVTRLNAKEIHPLSDLPESDGPLKASQSRVHKQGIKKSLTQGVEQTSIPALRTILFASSSAGERLETVVERCPQLASLPEDKPLKEPPDQDLTLPSSTLEVKTNGQDQPFDICPAQWHEVQVVPVQDPVTGKDAILLLQTDITTRAIMEQRMAVLTESQLSMLEEMFPRHVLEFIMGAAPPEATLGDLAYQHDDVTILFMDIVGFTSMSKEVPPQSVMEFLNSLFSTFDLLLDDFNVYKVETAGDCYIVAGALMSSDKEGFMVLDGEGDARDGARSVILFAQAMLSHARTVRMPHNGQPTCVRVGVHTGSVVSGLIGSKLPKFSLFGDTMNTSSRMESTSQPGCIQISESTYAMLEEDQRSLFEATGGVEVKGKGLMPTYIYQPTEEALKLPSIQDESPSSPEKGKNNLLVSATESLEDSSQTPNGSGRSPNQGSKRRSSVSYPIAWMLAQNHPAAETDGASKWHNYTKSGRSQELPLFALPLTSKNYPVGAPNATLSPVDRPMSNLLALGENLDHDTSNAHPPLQHRSTGLVSRDGEWSRANSGIPSSSGRAPDLNRVSSKDAPSTLALLFNKQTSRISPSFDEKEEKEEVKDEEKDEVREMTTVLPPPAPVRRKPVKRNTLQSLTAAFSNLQQPLP